MPNLLLDRYLSGQQHGEVWQDMVALGAAVRNDLYYKDVKEVADETMKRARRNIESIIPKLDALGYKFCSPEDEIPVPLDPFAAVQQSMTRMLQTPGSLGGLPGMLGNGDPAQILKDTMARMSQYGQPGSEPRNAHESAMAQMAKNMEMMKASMAQRAPQLAERRTAAEALRRKYDNKPSLQNPRVFDPSTKKTLKELEHLENQLDGSLPVSLRSWYEHVGGVSLEGKHEVLSPEGHSPEPLMILSFSDSKQFMETMMDPDELDDEGFEWMLWAEEGGQFTMKIPDPAADAPIVGLPDATFVEYLRTVFAWGGFPGWRRSSQYPQKELDHLREGLLAL